MKQILIALLVSVFVSQKATAGPIPDVGQSKSVYIQCWMGTYLCAENGGNGLLVANRESPELWERFEITRISDTEVVLKSQSGKFVSAQNGGGSEIIVNGPAINLWEKFTVELVPGTGFYSFKSINGDYLTALDYGVVRCNRRSADHWEMFRVFDADKVSKNQTKIEINVYKIGSAPFWHTGTVVDNTEYFFQTTNRVENCAPKGMNLEHHRTMVRYVPGDMAQVKKVLSEAAADWDNTSYDLLSHNCNYFTDDLLNRLGVQGLDSEYLTNSGLQKIGYIPGTAVVQEILVKWPITDKRMDAAFMDDLKKLRGIPGDVERELRPHLQDSIYRDTSREVKKAGGDVAKEIKKVLGI